MNISQKSLSSAGAVGWAVGKLSAWTRTALHGHACRLMDTHTGAWTRIATVPQQVTSYILIYKIRHTSTPAYLSHHIRSWEPTRHLRSSSTPLLHKPTTRTHFADSVFRCSAPAVWNSLNTDTLCCSSLALFRH